MNCLQFQISEDIVTRHTCQTLLSMSVNAVHTVHTVQPECFVSLLLADRFIDRIIINVNVNVHVSPCSPYGPCESGQVLSNGQKTSVPVPEEGGDCRECFVSLLLANRIIIK